jgi:hypothetical protein
MENKKSDTRSNEGNRGILMMLFVTGFTVGIMVYIFSTAKAES